MFAPLAAPLDRIHRELKQAFDPAGVFNRGRLYPGCRRLVDPTPLRARCKPTSLPNSRTRPTATEAEAILRKCVHCGFCTATCPTYQLLGDELDGPRGRIYLIKQVLEGAPADAHDAAAPRPLPDLPQLRDAPARRGVQYGHLVEIGRSIVDERVERPARRARRALAAEGGADLAAVRAGDEGSASRCGRCCRRR